MKEFLVFIGLVLLVAAAAIWGFVAWNYPSGSVRYEVTVEVEVNGQVFSGSSVHEVTLGRQSQFLASAPVWRRFEGEAVVVDIADRGTLFALLTGPCDLEQTTSFRPVCSGQTDLARTMFDFPSASREFVRSMGRIEASVEVPVEQMPLLVQFDDLSDPASVEYVDPRDLVASFGDGVRLLRIRMETTNRRVTRTIERILPWIPDYRDGMLDGFSHSSMGRGFANSLSTAHLKR